MTRRDRLPFPAVIGMLLITVGLLLRDGRTLALAVPFVVYTGVWWVASVRCPRPCVELRRSLSSERVDEGRTVDVVLSVENVGPSLAHMALHDGPPTGAEVCSGHTSFLGELPAGRRACVEYTLRASRGAHAGTGTRITVWGGLPLCSRTVHVPCEERFLVLPMVRPLPSLPIRPRRTRVYSGIVKARAGGPGVEFFGCREYVSGDDVRRINWRAYAQRGELIVNECEQERVADVHIVLDARATTNAVGGAAPLFDAAIHAASSMACHFLDRGNYVGLLIYGDVLDWTYPGYGNPQKARILNALALAEPRDKPAFADLRSLPTRLFPSNTQLIVISPLVGRDDVRILGTLRARGYDLLLVCPSGLRAERAHWESVWPKKKEAFAVAERILLLERELLLGALRRLGIVVVDWDPLEPLEDAVAPAAAWLRGGATR